MVNGLRVSTLCPIIPQVILNKEKNGHQGTIETKKQLKIQKELYLTDHENITLKLKDN